MTEESSESLVWLDSRSWTDNWAPIEKLLGGGQGEAFKAKRKSDGLIAFVKTIKSKRNPERRARFFREASAFDSFEVEGIPRLIESNAHFHKDPAYLPYLATEFVEGPTLRKWREQARDVNLATAARMTSSLLRILGRCHASGCVHRDIKPENLILPDGASEPVALLDFGLNYHELSEADFQTEYGQEIGNRFLRLPELSAGSELKQDPRSDVTFAAGILFYILTGRHPDILLDAEGRLPHQRGDCPSILQQAAGSRFRGLIAIFDDAFAPQLASRFASVNDLALGLENLMATQGTENSPESDLAAIRSIMGTGAEKRRAETTATFEQALMQIRKAFNNVTAELGGSFVAGQTGQRVTTEVGRSTLFWTRPGSVERVLNVAHDVRQVGDELVVRMEGEPVIRTSFGSPDFGESFRASLRSWLLAKLRVAVQGSVPTPPELEQFRDLRPLMNLDDAVAEASKTERRIMLFTYDPELPERGKLHYALLYFLQNQKTRDVLSASFVLALVPVGETRKVIPVLDGKSMENARWVILDDQLNVLEEAVVYANPQVAEGIADRLADQYGSGVG